MKLKSLIKLSLVGSIFVLASCSSVLDTPTKLENTVAISHSDSLWQTHLQQLQKIKSYQAVGQFGYISVQPKEHFSASFDWKYENSQNFEFLLSSSLSSQFFKLQQSPQGLTISDNKYSRTGEDANAVLEKTLGVGFPLMQLGDWLKGVPAENSQYVVNEKRQLAQFNYGLKGQNWRVRYLRYDETKQPNLPTLIALDNGNQTVKIGINNWKY